MNQLLSENLHITQPNAVVVLIGMLEDSVLGYLATHLMASDVPVLWFDQRELGSSLMCHPEGWRHKQFDWFIAHESIAAVYNRCLDLMQGPYEWAQRMALYYLDQRVTTVINRPASGLSNYSKLKQLSQLSGTIFQRPMSQLSVGVEPPLGDWIFKSASAIRSIVHLTQLIQPNHQGAEPVLYQRRIEGLQVRVHVFQSKCYAMAIKSSSIDYRYDHTAHFKDYQLPTTVELACCELTQRLGLMLSGIDLIYTSKEWFILEVNTAPGFDFFERRSEDRALSDAICHYFKGCVVG